MRDKIAVKDKPIHAQTASRRRLLILDDDDGMKELLTEMLGTRYEVRVVSHGLDLPRLMAEFTPHLVILDIMMPWVTGYDLCRSIKSHPAWKNTPVLMLSAKKKPEDIELARDRGADAYLTKPFAMQDLRDKIADLLREARGGVGR